MYDIYKNGEIVRNETTEPRSVGSVARWEVTLTSLECRRHTYMPTTPPR